MAIVFGWNSFKVRSFTLEEIGITDQNEAGLEFEVRQSYFHIFWIPFFSLDKRWVVHKGGKMYEMPGEIQALAERKLTGIRTPWYTFTGPILLLIGCIVFSMYLSQQDAADHKEKADKFREKANELTNRLQHLTTNDFITIENRSHSSHYLMFLKVEAIKGDEITVTPVGSDKHEPMMVEKAYTRQSGTFPAVKISYKQLLKAFPKELDSLEWDAMNRQAAHLCNDDKLYLVKDVVRHFMPGIKVHFAAFLTSGLSIHCHNEGWPATITEINNLEGNIDWSQMINKEIPGGQDEYSQYSIEGRNIRTGEAYKFVMTLKDTTGHLYKFEFEVKGNEEVTVHAL
jgi:hypothetical protein